MIKYYLVIILMLIASFFVLNQYGKNKDKKTLSKDLTIEEPCGNVESNPYVLNEIFFDKDELLKLNFRIVYFTNDYPDTLSIKYLQNRVKISNYFFKDAGLEFLLKEIIYIKGRPDSIASNVEMIKSYEALNGGKIRSDVRSKYYIDHFHFWNSVYGEEGVMTAYIFHDDKPSWAGIAGGIGANYFAINNKYVTPRYHTWEHEKGHDLGLFHTHQHDPTDGLNNLTGDLVCDTYTSSDTLINTVDGECNHDGSLDIPEEHLIVLIENIMSYTNYYCRSNFTEIQNMRMKKTIETNTDLRKTIVGYEGLNARLWKNLKEMD